MSVGRADLLVLLAALIWGLAYLAQKTAMTDLGPFAFVACRSTIAALVLLPFALREGGPRPWRLTVVGGVLFFLSAGIQQLGIVTATVSNTAFLTALYVVIAPVLGLILWRRSAGWRVWTGAALALLGAFTMSGGHLARFGTGDWLVGASALGWAGYMLATEAAGKAARPLSYTAGVFAVVAIIAWPIAIARDGIDFATIAPALPEVFFVGVFSSAITFGLLSTAMGHIPAPRAAIILSSEAVFAAVAAAVILDERFGLYGWAGAALILTAIILVQTAPPARKS